MGEKAAPGGERPTPHRSQRPAGLYGKSTADVRYGADGLCHRLHPQHHADARQRQLARHHGRRHAGLRRLPQPLASRQKPGETGPTRTDRSRTHEAAGRSLRRLEVAQGRHGNAAGSHDGSLWQQPRQREYPRDDQSARSLCGRRLPARSASRLRPRPKLSVAEPLCEYSAASRDRSGPFRIQYRHDARPGDAHKVLTGQDDSLNRRSFVKLVGATALFGGEPFATGEAPGNVDSKLDRKALIGRHKIAFTRPDSFTPLSVGNGEFAFTADITGLQTFPEFHSGGMRLQTMAQWSWHTTP